MLTKGRLHRGKKRGNLGGGKGGKGGKSSDRLDIILLVKTGISGRRIYEPVGEGGDTEPLRGTRDQKPHFISSVPRAVSGDTKHGVRIGKDKRTKKALGGVRQHSTGKRAPLLPSSGSCLNGKKGTRWNRLPNSTGTRVFFATHTRQGKD